MNASPKILIVEDESIIAFDLKNLLSQLGYKVSDTVDSGKNVIKSIEDNRPDLILMDIKLKGEMNGIEAANKLHHNYNIPVIYLTANADIATVERAKKTDAYGFVYKPIQPDVLQSVIELALYKHQTEQKLLEREAWLEATLQSIGDAVIATDSKGKITFMNPIAESLTGWKQDEAIQHSLENIFKIYHSKTRKVIKNPIDKVIETGDIIGLGNHTLLISKDGKEYQISDSASPIFNANNEITGIVLVFRDITKEYAMKEALKQSESLLSNVFNSIQDGVSVLDKDLNILRVNKIMQEWYAHIAPLENKKCFLCYQNRNTPCEPCPSLRALESGVTESNIVPGPANSAIKWIELFAFPVKNQETQETLGVVEFVRNVTEKKEALIDLEERIQQINVLHLLAKQVSNSSSLEYVIEASLDGIMTTLTPDLAMLFLYEEEQLILKGERFIDKKLNHFNTPVFNSNECFYGNAITEKRSLFFNNIDFNSKIENNEFKKMGFKSFAAIPLLSQNEIIGLLNIASVKERNFNNEKIFIETISNEIATGLKNALLFSQLNHQVDTLEKEILERMQIESALRISEERFRRLAENSPDIIFRMSLPEGKYEYISDAVEKISGYPPIDFYKNQFLIHEIVHEDYVEYLKLEWEKLLTGEPPDVYEFKIKHKNGNIHWIHQRNVLVKDNHGNLVAIEGICTDVTQQKETMIELINARKFLETALAHSPSGILIADAPDVKIKMANSAAFKIRKGDKRILTDIEVEQHSKNWQIFKPDGTPFPSEELPLSRAVMKGETIVNEEVIIRDESGIDHWVSSNASPILNAEGEVISGIVIFHEITGRKAALEQIKKNETKLSSIFKAAPIGIGIVLNRHFVEVNELVCEITGYSKDELIGKNARMLYPTQEDYDYVGREKYRQISEKGTGTVETHFKRKDGTIIDVLLSSTPFDVADFSKGVTFTVLDISKRKASERERELLIDELENKNEELERFTYTVSHDLKSPMITISGFLDILIKDIRVNKQDNVEADYIRIKDAVQKMDKLLIDILKLSRIGRIVNPPEKIKFNKIVENALSLTKGIIEKNNVRVDVQPNMNAVYVDPIRIQEVLTNLIENAVKFTQKTKSPSIKIGSKIINNVNTFYLKDNGIGIKPEYHHKIFQLFDKLDPESEGSGIGLALVKRIINGHQGSIWIESKGKNKGTTFYFTLPEKSLSI